MVAARPRSFVRRSAAAGLAALAAGVGSAAPAVAHPSSASVGGSVASVTDPRLPNTSTSMDVRANYQGQTSCDPAAKPGVEAYARLLLTTYRTGRNGGIVRGCGLGSTSEHKEGRAFDYMLDSTDSYEKAVGDSLTRWLTGPDSRGYDAGNARRLGVMYVIWNRRFWSTYTGTWRTYTGPNPHTDHVHTSFSWDGAVQRTSGWDGSQVTQLDQGTCRVYDEQPAPVYTTRRTSSCPTDLPSPPSSPYPIVWPGESGSNVRLAQQRLGVSADGVFGSVTRSRLMSWQTGTRVPVSGVLDKPTWARLVPPRIDLGWAVSGDWDGDGDSDPGWFDDGVFSLRWTDGSTRRIGLGGPGDQPVIGDWNDDGRDGIGVFRAGRWSLRNSLLGLGEVTSFSYGVFPGDRPVVGRWTSVSPVGIGVVRDGRWLLRETAADGPVDLEVAWPGDGRPLLGAWTGSGLAKPGWVADGSWRLSGSVLEPATWARVAFGRGGDDYLVGHWVPGGIDTPGVARSQSFFWRTDLSGGDPTGSSTYRP